MTANILIFDSGVGGLSVLQEIQQQLPHAPLHYLMDNAAFPYGTKSDDYLVERVLQVCAAAIEQLNPQLLVIACNTASTLALNELRSRFTLPIVGVVPAIKVAAKESTNQHIGLIATLATVNRSYTQQLIDDFAAGKTVHKFGSDVLVRLAENYINLGTTPSLNELQQHLQPWFDNTPKLSHIVLGCTHFPLLKPFLQQLWPEITWVDSGAAIARRVFQLLPDIPKTNRSSVSLYWTDEHCCPSGVVSYLQQHYSLIKQGSLPLKNHHTLTKRLV